MPPKTRSEMAAKPVVYRLPGMDSVRVRSGVAYRDALAMDLYYPPQPSPGPRPVVVIVLGYPDVGVPLPFGCQFREMEGIICWARLFAASGMIGVAYETRDPASDAAALLAYLHGNAPSLGIDAERIGIWAASGNVPVALSLAMENSVRCAALCYGMMLDLDGSTGIAQAASQFFFANPTAGHGVERIPSNVPLFLARAGRDQFAAVNPSIDAFLAAALRANLPVTLRNHPTGPHAFDLLDDSETSRSVIRDVLEFLRSNLAA